MKDLILKFSVMQSRMQSMLRDEKGATMVEYALMVALIAVICVGAVTAVGQGTLATFNAVVAGL